MFKFTGFRRRRLLALCLLLSTVGATALGINHWRSAADVLTPYRGRWVFINVWAAWCAPCISEMQALDTFYQQHHSQVAVLGVSFDHTSPQELMAFAKAHQLHFPLLSRFPFGRIGLKHIDQVPMTVVVSPQGDVVNVLMGPQTVASLSKAVGEAPPAQADLTPDAPIANTGHA